jgi:hypothetical protein
MYEPDEQDAVVELESLPQSDIGAPLPAVAAAEHFLALAYLASEPDPDWDGTYVTVVGPDSEGVLVAAVTFERPYCHLFGPPNDEAFSGHPLASRGLHPYGAFEVHHSSWLRSLERMNSVHPYHRPELFSSYKHFVFAFHDSTFECVARAFTVTLQRGSLESVMQTLVRESLRGAA